MKKLAWNSTFKKLRSWHRFHHFMANRWGKSGNSDRFYFLEFQIHGRWWQQLWNSKMLAPGRKAMTNLAAAAAAKSLQSRPTMCDLIDGSPPGSCIPGILQARTLEWVAISFSNAWKWKVKVKLLSRVRLLATPWTAKETCHTHTDISVTHSHTCLTHPPPVTHTTVTNTQCYIHTLL